MGRCKPPERLRSLSLSPKSIRRLVSALTSEINGKHKSPEVERHEWFA